MFTQLDTAIFFHLASFLSVPEQIQLRKIYKAFNHEITTEMVLYVTPSERYSLPEFHAVMDQYAEEDKVLLSRVADSLPEDFYHQIVAKVFGRKITSSLRNQINLEIFFWLHVKCPEIIFNGRVYVVNQLMLRHGHNSEEKSSLQAIDSLPEFSDLLLQFTGWVDRRYSNAETPQQQSLVFLQNLRSDLCYRAEKFNSFVQEALLHLEPTFYFPAMYITLLLYRAEEITSLLQKEKISLPQFFSFGPFFISMLIQHVEKVVSLVEGAKMSLQQLHDASVDVKYLLLNYTKEVICLTKETTISLQELLALPTNFLEQLIYYKKSFVYLAKEGRISLQQLYDVPSGIRHFLLAHINEAVYLKEEITISLQELLDLPEHMADFLCYRSENLVYLVKKGRISMQQLQSFSEDFTDWLLSNPKLKISFTYLFKEVLFLFLFILFAVPCLIIPGYRCLIEDQAKDVGYACYYQFFIRKIPMSNQVHNEIAIAVPT